jgi:hypothetical protein
MQLKETIGKLAKDDNYFIMADSLAAVSFNVYA